MVTSQYNPIVLDVGSHTIRAGWAGGDQPKLAESSYLAMRMDGTIDPTPLRRGGVVGNMRCVTFNERWLIHPGSLEAISSSMLCSQRGLGVSSSLEHAVIATCPTGSSAEYKKYFFTHFMETVQVPGFFLGDTSVLSLYASGRVGGIVADIGAAHTTVSQIAGGVIKKWTSHSSMCGDRIDEFIASRLSLDRSVIAAIKHGGCKCSHHAPVVSNSPMNTRRGSRKHHAESVMFKLPDGSDIDISSVQEAAAETLFQEDNSLTEQIRELSVEEDFVVLTGGSSHFPGLHSRLVSEMPNCNIFPFTQWTHRSHSGYVGASILASLSSFASLWVTPANYAEHGVDRLVNMQ